MANLRHAINLAFEQLHIQATVASVVRSPQVTRYLCRLGNNGRGLERARKLKRDAVDIAMAVGVPSLQVVPVPEQGAVVLEVPNEHRVFVHLHRAMRTGVFVEATRNAETLLVVLGITASDVLVADLVDMPHLLVAGATGSGKSVLLRTIIEALTIVRQPEDVRLLLIDPKRVEMNGYQGSPHLVKATGTPIPGVIHDPLVAGIALSLAINAMEHRYNLFRQAEVTNITEYRQQGGKLHRIVIVIDELADLMFTNRVNVEARLVRLAQLGRGAGIHLVVATQRPSVDVVTGLIKANFPVRVAMKVASKVDSRVILDVNGAESLLGKGDLLYRDSTGEVTRAQGCYI